MTRWTRNAKSIWKHAYDNNNNSKASFAKVQWYLYPFRYNGYKFQILFPKEMHKNRLS